MSISIEFHKLMPSATGPVILPLYQEQMAEDFTPAAPAVKEALSILKAATNKDNMPEFKAKAGEIIQILAGDHDSCTPYIFAGLGAQNGADTVKNHEEAGGKAAALLKQNNIGQAKLIAGHLTHAQSLIMGMRLRSYSFVKHKDQNDKKAKAPWALKMLHVIAENDKQLAEAISAQDGLMEGINFARDLVNEPANLLYPESYAARIKEELKPLGVEIDILDEKKMEKLGMGAIMAVGKGSQRQPRMVIMRWNGAEDKASKPVALVGKGVTFDTGGISIKPAGGMDEMKMDMGGSAAVVGAMKALAQQKAQANVVGIVGLAENMPSSNAYRPGDIITSLSGKTVEVLNTDAEGRLVLADALTYVQQKFDPHTIIDLATLTGAIMVALGSEFCGTFANEDSLWDDLSNAAQQGQEKIWRMPLDPAYTKEMVSDVADLRNLGKSRYGGACTAAAFLGHFVDEGRKWAHMDIAGTAWVKADRPTMPKHATGFGVRTLVQLVNNAAKQSHAKAAA